MINELKKNQLNKVIIYNGSKFKWKLHHHSKKKQKQNELCEIYCESRYLEEIKDKKGIKAKWNKVTGL